MVSLGGYKAFSTPPAELVVVARSSYSKESPPTCGKTTVGRLFEVYRPCRCKSIQRAVAWGTNRKSITGSSLFAKSSVKRIMPSVVSKGNSVCVPSGAMRTSFLSSSSPAGNAILTPDRWAALGCLRIFALFLKTKFLHF